MINERGFISLTALFVMIMLAITVRGVTDIARNQADITRFYKLETRMQNAAESAFNQSVSEIINNESFNGQALSFDLSLDSYVSRSLTVDGINVTVYLKTKKRKIKNFPSDNEDTYFYVTVLNSLAEIPQYFYDYGNAYRRVSGYMEKIEVIDRESNTKVDGYEQYEKFKFKEYLD